MPSWGVSSPVQADGTTLQLVAGTLSVKTAGIAAANLAAGVVRAVLAGGPTNSGTGTQYASPASRVSLSASEAPIQGAVPYACTAKNLRVELNANASATQNTVVTLRKNGVDTALTVTITALSLAGDVFSDVTHSVALAAGDELSYTFVTGGAQNGGTATCILELAI